MRLAGCLCALAVLAAAFAPTAFSQAPRSMRMVGSSGVAQAGYYGMSGFRGGAVAYGGGGCGCEAPSCGCEAPACGGGACCDPCQSCCPCLIPRIIHGVGRVIDCLFTCRCGGCCGAGDCTYGGGCVGGGCGAPGYAGGGCSSCGGGGGQHWSSESSDPFMDDMPHQSPTRAPAPSKDARYAPRGTSHVMAPGRGSKPRVVGPIHVSPPRVLDSRTSAKPLNGATRIASRETRDGKVIKTSAVSERSSSRSNPLRAE